MPIYEYECKKCKAHVEALQKMSDKPLTKCRKCGGRLEKQWSNTSFQLKGSGWYLTDYAGKKTDAKEEKKEEKKSSPASEPATTDTKSASKETSNETSKAKPSKASGKPAPPSTSGD